MSLFSSSPAAKGATISAIVLATAGAGVTFLSDKASPPEAAVQTLVSAAPPASTALEAPALAAREVPAPAVSQAGTLLEVATLTHTAAGKAPPPRRFPFVSSADASVAARINNLLFIDTFEVPAPARASDGLREVNAAMWQQRPEIDFKVQRNDGRIFSVTFATEGCGAYCESYNTAYAFDAANGRHLGVQDLFSAAGQAALAKEIKTASLAAIKAEISRLKSEGAKGGGNAQGLSAQDRATAIQMYEGCAQQRQSPDYEAGGLGTLQIQAQAVALSAERCSNHAMRALDALGEFSASFSPEQFKPWLSDYGRHLLLGETSSFAAPASPWGQVLRGQIGGKLPVTMALGFVRSDGSVSAQYFYDRHRKPIAVAGNFQSGTLTLTETDSKDASPPRLVLKPHGIELRGRWEGQTTLDVELKP